MKNKKIIINVGIVLIFISVVIGIACSKLLGSKSQEINASKQFMSKLYSIEAVDTTDKLADLKYEKVKTINSQNQLVNKTIVTQKFGIDLDKDNNVVGFAKKDMHRNITKISIDNAKNKADEYLKEIYGDEVVYKDVKNEKDLPYYSFLYTKKFKGYELYFDEIKVNINKETSLLDGYSNTTMQKQCSEPEITISEEEAKHIADDFFHKYNSDGQINDEIQLVYAENKLENKQSNMLQVCYVITINGKSTDGMDVVWKIFVNASNGEIYNSIKDNVEKEVSVD